MVRGRLPIQKSHSWVVSAVAAITDGSGCRSSGKRFLWSVSLVLQVFLLYRAAGTACSSSIATTTTSSRYPLQCANGWKANDEEEMQDIPSDWINDGYCDCPIDGIDEPDTEACSGSFFWPGIRRRRSATNGASSETERPFPLLFPCPQQVNLQLPLSRLDDGICDCCDGKDERTTTAAIDVETTTTSSGNSNNKNKNIILSSPCHDICEQVLKAEREARKKLEMDFQKGYQRRQLELKSFQQLRATKVREVEEMEMKLHQQIIPSIEIVQGQIRELKHEYVKQRVATMKDKVVSSEAGMQLIASLQRIELEQFIIHSCQIAGELSNEDGSSTTCVPLRVAGLDLALTWSDDNYNSIDEMKGEANMTADMIHLIFDNAVQGGTLKWKKDINKKHNRRRLDEIYHDDGIQDDDYMDDYYEDYHDQKHYGQMEEDSEGDQPDENSNSDDIADTHQAQGRQKEIMDTIMTSRFSKTRNAFLSRAKTLSEEITKLLDSMPAEESDNNVDKDEEVVESNMDPATYTVVRTDLRKRESSIEKGLKWGASSKLLFLFSDQSDNNLQRLAIGTLYYGQLSALHVWQILQSILPEYSETMKAQPTCGSTWADSCPPKTITRNDASYPPYFIIDAAIDFCETEMTKSSTQEMQQICPSHDQDEAAAPGDSAAPPTIPSSIPDGYFGYTAPTPRSEGDPLANAIFVPISSLPVPAEEVEALEGKKRDAENEKKELEKAINDTWKDIGGKNGGEMGENGELYAMADQCYSVNAGKYTYEVCIFGRASQKEGQGSSGTNLGNWRGIERDSETGRRVMKWEGGAKCWNGPSRSATVYITCGTETKVLSANEPDTCRYELEMESPIGCDDDFRVKMGL